VDWVKNSWLVMLAGFWLYGKYDEIAEDTA
jgi:hypothetical protein